MGGEESIFYFYQKKLDFIYTYNIGWLFLIIIFAGLASFWLYYRAKEWTDLSAVWKWILAIFRFSILSIIGFLLLGVILKKTDNKSQKPIAFILHDQSESIIQTKDSSFYKNDYIKSIHHLASGLKDKFEVVQYGFSNKVDFRIDSNYNHKLTDISEAFNQVYNQYANRNVGAIILSSDGIYTNGQNPIYTITQKSNIPVFSIGLGDTTVAKDVLINDVVNNDIAFLGNEFPVQVILSQNGFSNESLKVDVYSNSKLIKSKRVKFDANQTDLQVDFQFVANSLGYKKYSIRITNLEGESTYKNNTKNFYVNVIDGRQKVLLTYSHSHPDISALNYVIEHNKNYDLTTLPISELKNDLNVYDLIIVHNYQSTSKALSEVIVSNKVPVLHIIGVNSDFKGLSKANIGLKGNGDKYEDIVFDGNINFKDISYDPNIFKLIGNAPPLSSPQGNISFSETIETIAFQKIGNITLSKPLIYANRKGGNKYAVILGEGIWRWRLYDQMKNNSTNQFSNFFSQLITYLAVKENKDPFKINIDNEFEESEDVIVRAELYNASYQLTNEPEVDFKLFDEDGKVFDYSFFRTSETYILELGRLKQGIYNWETKTLLNEKRYTKKGTFVVKEIKREMLNLTADHRLLNSLSKNTNGKFYGPRNLETLQKDLLNREDIVAITYQEKNFKDLIDYKWLFFLVFVFIAIEWFLRKFHGGY
ncbi:MAG: hypothetical protein AB8B74_09040 [Crocinitomicaceae bacterium]